MVSFLTHIVIGFSGSANSNMLSEFFTEQRELPLQPNLGKVSQNCSDISFGQEIENFFVRL